MVGRTPQPPSKLEKPEDHACAALAHGGPNAKYPCLLQEALRCLQGATECRRDAFGLLSLCCRDLQLVQSICTPQLSTPSAHPALIAQAESTLPTSASPRLPATISCWVAGSHVLLSLLGSCNWQHADDAPHRCSSLAEQFSILSTTHVHAGHTGMDHGPHTLSRAYCWPDEPRGPACSRSSAASRGRTRPSRPRQPQRLERWRFGRRGRRRACW